MFMFQQHSSRQPHSPLDVVGCQQQLCHAGSKPSWTAKLANNQELLCSKIREEAGELCQTLEQQEGQDRAASEMADLLYHSMVLLNVQVYSVPIHAVFRCAAPLSHCVQGMSSDSALASAVYFSRRTVQELTAHVLTSSRFASLIPLRKLCQALGVSYEADSKMGVSLTSPWAVFCCLMWVFSDSSSHTSGNPC